MLSDRGYPGPLASKLEEILLGYTGERNSRGILQGMYPSDLFGNFYLAPVDQFLKDDLGVPSTRYVDDLYIFLDSIQSSVPVVRKLIPMLRSYDLILNEAKSRILPAKTLLTEEPDLEELFNDAFEEAKDQLTDEEMQSDTASRRSGTKATTRSARRSNSQQRGRSLNPSKTTPVTKRT